MFNSMMFLAVDETGTSEVFEDFEIDTSLTNAVNSQPALGGDGIWCAWGDQSYNSNDGRVEIYKWNVDTLTWSSEQVITNGSSAEELGRSLDMNEDSDKMLISAPAGQPSGAGEVQYWTRSGDTWSLQSTFVANGTTSGDKFGYLVKANRDFTYCAVAVGGSLDNLQVFTRSGSTWTHQYTISKIVAIDGSMQFSDAGDRLVFTVINAEPLGTQQPTEIWVRSGSTWSNEHTFTSSGSAYGCAMSSDGATIFISKNESPTPYNPVIEVFTRSGSTWSFSTSFTNTFTTSPPGGDALNHVVRCNAAGTVVVVMMRAFSDDGLRREVAVWEYDTSWTEVIAEKLVCRLVLNNEIQIDDAGSVWIYIQDDQVADGWLSANKVDWTV